MKTTAPLFFSLLLIVLFFGNSTARAQTSPKSPFPFADLVGACNTDGLELGTFTATASESKVSFLPEYREGFATTTQVSAPERRIYTISLHHNARQGSIEISALGARELTIPAAVAVQVTDTLTAKKAITCADLKGYTGTYRDFSESLLKAERVAGAKAERAASDVTVRFDTVPAFQKIREEFKPALKGSFAGVREFCGNNPKASFKLSCKLTESRWSVSTGAQSKTTHLTSSASTLTASIENWVFYVPAEKWEERLDDVSLAVPTLSETTAEYQVELSRKMPCAEIVKHTSDQDFRASCGTDLRKWEVLATKVNSDPSKRAVLSPSHYQGERKVSR